MSQPTCPKCGGAMSLRTQRQTQSKFWGCLRFPHCRGTLNFIPEALQAKLRIASEPTRASREVRTRPASTSAIRQAVKVNIPVGALLYDPREPDAGSLRFLGCFDDGSGEVGEFVLERSGEHRHYRWGSQPYRRQCLHYGAPVEFEEDGEFIKGSVAEAPKQPSEELWVYSVDTERGMWEVDESRLTPLRAATNSPVDIIESLEWRGARRFALRWQIAQVRSSWYAETEGLPALFGSRIRPLGHQLYAAKRVLGDRAPRFVLADEVGLGKTIEAGLVIQSLTFENPRLRVLVIAPGSMSRQWFCELYLRFGGRAYTLVDAERIRASSHGEILASLKSERIVVSTTAIEAYPSIGKLLACQKWGMVVVDEAHHYGPDTELYDVFCELSKNSYGFLALSATPSKRELGSLLSLMALVAPDAYEQMDLNTFESRYEKLKEVWDKLNLTVDYIQAIIEHDEDITQDDLDFLVEDWEGLLDDPLVAEILEQMREGATEAADHLVSHVKEFHRLDHRLIRTRRATVDANQAFWSPRTLEIVSYEASTEEQLLAHHFEAAPVPEDDNQRALLLVLQRLACSTPSCLRRALSIRKEAIHSDTSAANKNFYRLLKSDPSPKDEQHIIRSVLEKAPNLPGERKWLEVAVELVDSWNRTKEIKRMEAAIQWILARTVEETKEKFLVFSQEQSTVIEFAEQLSNVLGNAKVDTFYEGMEESALSRAAQGFQMGSTRVLVCDELGGEGRNFQIAHSVLHLDTPWSTSRLEQRIGRLDRVGRDLSRAVQSVVFCGPLLQEEALIELHRDAFKVYTESVGGLEFVLPAAQDRVMRACTLDSDELRAVADELTREIQLEKARVDDSFHKALDATRQHLDRANQLAITLEESQDSERFGPLYKWAGLMNIKSYPSGPDRYTYQWDWEHFRRVPRALSNSGRIPKEGKHECEGTYSIQLALNDESLQFFGPGHRLIDAILHDLKSTNEGTCTVLARDLGSEYLGQMFFIVVASCTIDSTDVPPGLVTRAHRHLWPEVQSELYHLDLAERLTSRVEDPELRALLLDPEEIMKFEKIKPQKLAGMAGKIAEVVRENLTTMLNKINLARIDKRAIASQELATELRPEIEYYRWRAERARDPDERGKLDRDRQDRELLLQRVANEITELEAIAVVVGVKR